MAATQLLQPLAALSANVLPWQLTGGAKLYKPIVFKPAPSMGTVGGAAVDEDMGPRPVPPSPTVALAPPAGALRIDTARSTATVEGEENEAAGALPVPPPAALAPFLARAAAHPALNLRVNCGGPVVARLYGTACKDGVSTTGDALTGFAALAKSSEVVRGAVPRIFHTIKASYVLDAFNETGLVITAEGPPVKGDPVVAALTAVHEGRPVAPSLEGGAGETAVQGIALLRFMSVRAPPTAAEANWNVRRFTTPELRATLLHLMTQHRGTLKNTRASALYGKGMPGEARREAYEEDHVRREAVVQEWFTQLDTPGSPVNVTLPKAQLTRSQGKNNMVPAAPTEFSTTERVLYLAAISCAGGARGAGTVMLRRVTALADAIGAYVFIRAVPMDGLCYTFYAAAGFQFVRHKVAMPTPGSKAANEAFECPFMMRAPNAGRREEAKDVPYPPSRNWGLVATTRFTPRDVHTTPYGAHVQAWDANDEESLRGQHLMAADGVLAEANAPRNISFPNLPLWGTPTVGDFVTDAAAREIMLHLCGPPTAGGAGARARDVEEEEEDAPPAKKPRVEERVEEEEEGLDGADSFVYPPALIAGMVATYGRVLGAPGAEEPAVYAALCVLVKLAEQGTILGAHEGPLRSPVETALRRHGRASLRVAQEGVRFFKCAATLGEPLPTSAVQLLLELADAFPASALLARDSAQAISESLEGDAYGY